MSKILDVTYYYHSGFSCAMGDVLCIFDYWEGENGELAEQRRITPELLARYREIYVFVSHGHPDHFSPAAFTWHREAPVSYIISYDMEIGTRGRRMKPGEELVLSDRVSVKAFDSTDLGVSYLVNIGGVKVFHAGDLNFWHWREESTPQEIDEAERDFHEALRPLKGEKLDVAFFPVDPRQGRMFDAGANYFILTIKPRLFIPMHFWGRVEVVNEFAGRSRCRDTEVYAMTQQGEHLKLEFAPDGFMTINVIPPERVRPDTFDMDEQGITAFAEYGENPFDDTDLPVTMEEQNNDH